MQGWRTNHEALSDCGVPEDDDDFDEYVFGHDDADDDWERPA